MHTDQLKEKWMQFKDELKQQRGKFTDEGLQRIEGNYEECAAKSKNDMPRTMSC